MFNLVPSVEPTDSGWPSVTDDRRSNLSPRCQGRIGMPSTTRGQKAGSAEGGKFLFFFQCFQVLSPLTSLFFFPSWTGISLVSSLTIAPDLPKAAHLAACLQPPAITERFVGPLYMLGRGLKQGRVRGRSQHLAGGTSLRPTSSVFAQGEEVNNGVFSCSFRVSKLTALVN